MDSVDFATAWTFSVEMSGSGCSASGEPTPTTTPSSSVLFHFPFEETHQIEITVNPENEANLIRPRPRLGGLAVAMMQFACGSGKASMRHFFLTSHSSATRHQWLNLFSTRHECFTSDVGLTRTRLVSCILLTSLFLDRTGFVSQIFEHIIRLSCFLVFALLSFLAPVNYNDNVNYNVIVHTNLPRSPVIVDRPGWRAKMASIEI